MLVPNKLKIVERRLELKLSQKALSQKAGLPENAVYRLENKDFRYIYPIRAKAIARALKCKVSDIFEEVIK